MRALLSGCDLLLALANSHSYFCKLLFKRREDSKLDFFFLDGARKLNKNVVYCFVFIKLLSFDNFQIHRNFYAFFIAIIIL